MGIVDYEIRHGFRGPEKTISITENTDLKDSAASTLDDLEEYNGFIPVLVSQVTKKSISVITKSGDTLEITGTGLKLIEKHILSKVETKQAVKPGAVLRVAKLNGEWKVVQLPQVEASLIALNPETGAVNALIGGFDFHRSKFNHVTQAWRQPGSSFKPFIYSAAIGKGFTPATMVG